MERREQGVPKIGGSFGGFIALVVCLSLIIIASGAAVIYLLRNPSQSASARRRRRLQNTGSTGSTAAFGLGLGHPARDASAGSASSAGGMKEKLAGMFQATLFSTRRGTGSDGAGGRGTWAPAPGDEWDSGEEELGGYETHARAREEMGMRDARRTVIVHPGHATRASERSSEHSAGHARGPSGDVSGFVVMQGYRPMSNGQVQPGRRSDTSRAPAPAPRATHVAYAPHRRVSGASDLSETSTFVQPPAPGRVRSGTVTQTSPLHSPVAPSPTALFSPPPPPLPPQAAQAAFVPPSPAHGRARPPARPAPSSSGSSANSVALSFETARSRQSPFGDDAGDEAGVGGMRTPVGEPRSPPTSTPLTFGGGTRFREGL